jgi:hypothetical protein
MICHGASDGRSPGLRVKAFHPPYQPFGPMALWMTLAAYSCGGSHGFGSFWIHLTVFPFHPPGVSVGGNHLCFVALQSEHYRMTGHANVCNATSYDYVEMKALASGDHSDPRVATAFFSRLQ